MSAQRTAFSGKLLLSSQRKRGSRKKIRARVLILRGKVIRGDNWGKKLGFPTANIRIRKNRIPDGVYAGYVRATSNKQQATSYPAMLFFGTPETVGGRTYRGEAHLIGFKGNLYGKWITMLPIKKLRSNRKFSSVEALKSQMKRDLKQTVQICKHIANSYEG
jgi:riboflavin kinase/FMN adenylyltransferase